MRGRFIVHVRESTARGRVLHGHGQTELGHGRIWAWGSKKGATDQETDKIAKRTSVPQMTRLYRGEQLGKGSQPWFGEVGGRKWCMPTRKTPYK